MQKAIILSIFESEMSDELNQHIENGWHVVFLDRYSDMDKTNSNFPVKYLVVIEKDKE